MAGSCRRKPFRSCHLLFFFCHRVKTQIVVDSKFRTARNNDLLQRILVGCQTLDFVMMPGTAFSFATVFIFRQELLHPIVMASQSRFRMASRDDATTIAMLHAASWRIAYRGLLLDEYLDNDLAGERITYWKKKMTILGEKEFVLLAVNDQDDAEGFISVMDEPEKGYSALVDNLHVRPDLKGRGLGRALMQEAARMLEQSGRSNYYLWVLNGNDPAARFYESIGGRADDERTVHFGGKDVKATRYVWSTFDLLVG